MIANNIAERIVLGIRGHLPYDWVGNLLAISKKDARIKMERFIEIYGGIKIYNVQNENSDEYNIFGIVEYAFFDSSVICLEGVSYYEIASPKGDVKSATNKMSSFFIMQAKIKCINLPKEWNNS